MAERDIVSRLREVTGFIQQEYGRIEAAGCLALEAADEIERLRAAPPHTQPIETAPQDEVIILFNAEGRQYAPCQWSKAGEISEGGFWL